MPLWGLSTPKRAAVELNSDDDRASGSTSSHSSTSSVTPDSKPTTTSPPPSQESLPNRVSAPAAPARGSPFETAATTTTTTPRGFTSRAAAGISRPMVLGVPTPQQLTVQAIYQRAMALQQPRHRSSVCSSANDTALNTPRAQSLRSSRGESFAFTPEVLKSHHTMNILVLGAPQVGKSLFINTYRAAVMNTTRWPAAPVGISGFYGTTTVEPFPNHPRAPTWLFVDTPGRLYTAENEVILEKLTVGMPWKTRLLGPKALTLDKVEDLTPIAANKAHQCVIVIPATDLIEDEGWMSTLLWRNRYRPTDDVAARILYIKNLTFSLRALMNDVSPFVVVTKMDKFGGASCRGACATVITVLSQCVPVNRIYFTAAVEHRASLAAGRAMVLESSTKKNLVRLHEDICLAVQWGHKIQAM